MLKFTLALALAIACVAPATISPAAAQAPARPRAAPTDPVTEQNLSRDNLKAAYDAAKLKATIDADGDIMIKDGVTVFAFPNKDRIRLIVYYGFKAAVTLQQKLELANRINEGYIVARATVGGTDQGQLQIDYYILIGAGVSKATIVAATKRFISIVPEAVKEHDKEDIVK